MKNNPFRLRTPLAADDLHVGRTEQVELAVDAVCQASQAQSIVFYGARKTGRTSLLKAIARRIEQADRDRAAAYIIDGRSIDSPTELCFHLINPVARTLGLAHHQLNASFEALARLIDMLQARRGPRIALLIDDFDLVIANPAFDLRVFGYLRSIISDGKVGMVMTAGRPLIDASESSEVKGSPFFNVLHERWLPRLSRADVWELLERALASGVNLAAEEDWILSESAGLPLLVQIAAAAAFDASQKPGSERYAKAQEMFEEEAEAYCGRVWRSLTLPERDVLKQIGESHEPVAGAFPHAMALEKMGLVERRRDGTWRISPEALWRWLKDNGELRVDVKPVDRTTDASQVFVSYAHEDADMLHDQELLGFMKGLERRGVRLWCDQHIAGGDRWHEGIARAIEASDAIVCVVSQFWLNSAYVQEVEMPAIRRKLQAGAHVVPFLVGECDWRTEDWLAALQMLPPGARPLRSMTERGEREAAYMSVLSTVKKCLGKVERRAVRAAAAG